MVRGLSNLSVPASIRNFAAFADKNFSDNPRNHPIIKFSLKYLLK
jgi:hypothetical protein